MPGAYDLLFEFKYAKLGDLGMTGAELRQADLQELENLPRVQDLFAEAETQIRWYRAALEERYGETLRLRAFAVVALGFERILGHEAGSL